MSRTLSGLQSCAAVQSRNYGANTPARAVLMAAAMTTRLLGSLLSTSLLLVTSACTDDSQSELHVTVHGDQQRGWVLTGPSDEADAVADQLTAALGAQGMTEGNGTAAITNGNSTVEVPLAGMADLSRVEAIATEHGFTGAPEKVVGSLKADVWAAAGNRGRIARAEVPSYDGTIYDSFAIYRPSTGQWFVDTYDGAGHYNTLRRQWGILEDRPLLGDYDGDGKSDTAVFRPSTGVWWIWTATGARSSFQWGVSGDIPVPGDYDGDKVTDAAFDRNGQWWLRLSHGGEKIVSLGGTPVPGDYDGDGKTDIATFGSGIWTILKSSTNQYVTYRVGANGDEPMPADYDGDGKTDPGVFSVRGEWLVLSSRNNYQYGPIEYWGYGTTDFPTRGDHDGDGKMDYNVWRPSNGTFYSLFWNGTSRSRVVGANYDQPVAGPYRYRPPFQLTP